MSELSTSACFVTKSLIPLRVIKLLSGFVQICVGRAEEIPKKVEKTLPASDWGGITPKYLRVVKWQPMCCYEFTHLPMSSAIAQSLAYVDLLIQLRSIIHLVVIKSELPLALLSGGD